MSNLCLNATTSRTSLPRANYLSVKRLLKLNQDLRQRQVLLSSETPPFILFRGEHRLCSIMKRIEQPFRIRVCLWLSHPCTYGQNRIRPLPLLPSWVISGRFRRQISAGYPCSLCSAFPRILHHVFLSIDGFSSVVSLSLQTTHRCTSPRPVDELDLAIEHRPSRMTDLG